MKQDQFAEWAKRIEELRASGLPATKFAAKIGVNVHTLRYWKAKVDARAKGQVAAAPRFVEVISAPVASTAPSIEVMTDDGTLVSVPSGCDLETIRCVLGVLKDVS